MLWNNSLRAIRHNRNLAYLAMAGVLLTMGLAIAIISLMVVRLGLPRAALIVAGLAAIPALMFASRAYRELILLIPLLALAVPIDFPTGTESRVPIAMAAVLALSALWLLRMRAHRRLELAASPLNQPLLWFSVACAVSLVWGIVWRDPFVEEYTNSRFIVTQLASLMTFYASFMASILIGNFVDNERQLRWIFGCFLVLGSLMTITQLFKINQPILNDRGLWSLWLIVPAMSLLIFGGQLSRGLRWILALIVLATLYLGVVVNSGWISGWIPPIVGLLGVLYLYRRHWFWILVVIVVGLAIAGRPFLEEVRDASIADGSLERLEIWYTNWLVIRDHPLLGTGPAGYTVYYMTYYADDARSTHNNYLDIISQFGVIGILLFAWFAVAVFREGWRLSRRAPPGILRAAAVAATAGWVGALASMMFGDWVLPFAYNQGIVGYKYTVYTWLFLGMLIAVRRILDKQATVQEAQA